MRMMKWFVRLVLERLPLDPFVMVSIVLGMLGLGLSAAKDNCLRTVGVLLMVPILAFCTLVFAMGGYEWIRKQFGRDE